jgi:hypothetical protein
MGSASSATSAQQAAPGFFLLAWGLFASVIGLGLVTNFRGFADMFTRSAYASSSWMRRVPPWKWMRRKSDEEELADRVKLARLIAIPFAFLGPIVTVVGVVQMLRGHVAVPRGPALPLPFALAFVGFALIAMFQYWRRGGFFRLAARRGGWMRGAAIVASLGAVAFGVFTALGQTTLGVAGWLVGGLASVPLVMSRGSVPTPPRDAVPARPSQPPAPTDPDEDDDASAFRWL